MSSFLNYSWQRCRWIFILFFHIQIFSWLNFRYVAKLFYLKTGKSSNRPLALRGHVTNASFKQWVGILLKLKIDRVHKNYLTPEIWEETHSREIFYGTLICQQSTCSIICIGRRVCPPTWRPKLLFACVLLNVWWLRSDVLKTLQQHLFNNFLEV